MKRYRKFLLLMIPAFLLIAIPIVASSSSFLPKAQKYIDNNCSDKHISTQNSLLCFLFYKSSEQDSKISNLENNIATKSAQILNLQTRVLALENPIGPTIKIFAMNRPASFSTDYMNIPTGFKSMTLDVSTTGSLATWSMVFKNGDYESEQHRFSCRSLPCQEVKIPIIASTYKFNTGTSSGLITAIATLNREPGGQSLLLGLGRDLPFTSEVINTTGFSTITVTAAVSERVPAGLSAIVLQRLESGVFVEKQRLVCDGGAECPIGNLPVLGGDYKVIVEGHGGQVTVAALLLP